MPNAKSSKQVMKQPITVSINAAGEYFVNKKPVTATSSGARIAGADCLAGTNNPENQPTVVLRVDAGLNVQKLVDVLEIGNRLKMKMVMATQSSRQLEILSYQPLIISFTADPFSW
ncbi:MAG: biopolymer transporter ExbD [Hymenobacter sp.]